MSFQNFKSDSYCFGGRHRSATKNVYVDITSKGSKVLIGHCSVCNRKKSMFFFLLILFKPKDKATFSSLWVKTLLKWVRN